MFLGGIERAALGLDERQLAQDDRARRRERERAFEQRLALVEPVRFAGAPSVVDQRLHLLELQEIEPCPDRVARRIDFEDPRHRRHRRRLVAGAELRVSQSRQRGQIAAVAAKRRFEARDRLLELAVREIHVPCRRLGWIERRSAFQDSVEVAQRAPEIAGLESAPCGRVLIIDLGRHAH